MNTKICIIPARSKSKRIPNKNIRLFAGKPIIYYSINAAVKSNLFDEIIVSTDSEEIAKISEEYGISIPFLRSKKNSDDHANIPDVIEEVLNNYLKNFNEKFDCFCCILPTAPLINIKNLKKGYKLLKKFDSVLTIKKYDFPIKRCLTLNNNKINIKNPKDYQKRSQDFTEYYHDAGQFYWQKTDIFIKEKSIINNNINIGSILLNEMEAQDIDTEDDWQMALLKYNFNKFLETENNIEIENNLLFNEKIHIENINKLENIKNIKSNENNDFKLENIKNE